MLNGFDWLSRMLIAIDSAKIHWWHSNKHHIDDYYAALCSVNDTTLKLHDGTMLSFFRMRGYGAILSDQEKMIASKNLEDRLKGFFSKPGHQIQIIDVSDPELTRRKVKNSMQPSLDELTRIGLGNPLFTSDYLEHVIKNSVWKEQFIVVRTSASSIAGEVYKGTETEEDKKIRLDKIRFIENVLETSDKHQGLFLSNEEKTTLEQHLSFCKTTFNAFTGIGALISSMNVSEGLVAQKESLYGQASPENWKPTLNGMDIASQAQTDNTDTPRLKTPYLAGQVMTSGAREDNLPTDVIQLGDRYYSTFSLFMGQPGILGHDNGLEPMKSYAGLLSLLPRDLPYITSMHLESEPFSTLAYKVDKVYVGMSAILPFTNNLQIRKARTAIERRHKERIEMSVHMTMTVSIHATSLDELQRYKRQMYAALSSWGGAQFRPVEMDKIQGVMATAPGVTDTPKLSRILESLSAAFYQSPIFMDGIAYDSGYLHFFTDQGRPFPIEEQSSKNINYNAYTCGDSGTGKSTLLTLFNLALLAKPKANPKLRGEIPLIFNVDFGKTSFGLTKMISKLVDEKKRLLFLCHEMTTDISSAYNVHDLPLGRNKPTMRHKAAIIRFLSVLLCGIDGTAESGFTIKNEDMVSMISFMVDEVYNMLDEKESPRHFDPSEFQHKDTLKALSQAGIEVSTEESYFSLADKLMAKDPKRNIWHAIILRRYAMPRLSDYSQVLSIKEEIASRYEKFKLSSGTSYKEFFMRRMTEALKEYPCFNRPTNINIDIARMISIDIRSVCGEDSHRKAIFGSLCLLMYLTKKENTEESEDLLKDVDPVYLPYLTRMNEINRFLPGVLNIEEAHVLIDLFEDVLNNAQRQNRKANWGLKTFSQRITDPSEVFFSLCSTIFITSDQASESFAPRFKEMRLSGAEQQVVKSGLSRNLTSFMAYIKVNASKEGEFSRIAIRLSAAVTSGLIWASNSNQLDIDFFDEVTKALGFDEAISRLQAFFPQGQIRKYYDTNWVKQQATEKGFDSVFSYFLHAITHSAKPDSDLVSVINRV